MKKQNLFLPLMAATAMLFASCNNNENVPNMDTKPATVKISIVSSSAMRGISETTQVAAESVIFNVEAYAFSGETMLDYQLIPGTGPSTATLNAVVGNVTIAVVANGGIGRFSSGTTDLTLTELKEMLSTYVFSKTNSRAIPATGFVMSKMILETLVEGENTRDYSLKRTVSKFSAPDCSEADLLLGDVDLATIKTIFPTFTASDDPYDITFAYNGFVLANGLNKSLLFNDATYANSKWPLTPWPVRSTWITTIPSPTTLTYLNSNFETDGSYPATDGVYSGADFITGTSTPVYTHENFPYKDFTVGSITGYNPLEVYCFIVEGTLSWGGTDVTRYWRINLVKSTDVDPTNDYYRIFRNGWYKVSVSEIKTIGWGTPKEAEEEVPVIPGEGDTIITIHVDVAPWDVYISTTQM